MLVISEYQNQDRKAVVVQQSGVYSESSVYFVEYYMDNKLVGRTQHNKASQAESVAEQYTDCIDTDVKQFLSE